MIDHLGSRDSAERRAAGARRRTRSRRIPFRSALYPCSFAPGPTASRFPTCVYKDRYPRWSPDGRRLAYTSSFVIELAKPWKEQSPKPVVVPPEVGARFQAWSWSPDGRYLVGNLRKADGASFGIAIYSLESGQVEQLTRFGNRPVWRADSRRLLFQDQSKVYVTDRQGLKPREILSVAPHTVDVPALSRDDRLMYFSVVVWEADIWLATLE